MLQKIIEFIYFGIITPVVYVLYCIGVILLVFAFGLPFGIAIHLIQMAVSNIFMGILN
jgi:hypothetical protein